MLLVGAPLRRNGRLYNCAVVICHGAHPRRRPQDLPAELPRVLREALVRLGRRHGRAADHGRPVTTVPFGTDLVFAATDLPDFVLGVEICEDYWAAVPPSSYAALAGATVLANLSASNIIVGKSADRAVLSAAQSARAVAAYVYSAAGPGESTHRPVLGRAGHGPRARRAARRVRALRRRAAAAGRRRRPRRVSGSSGCARPPSTTPRSPPASPSGASARVASSTARTAATSACAARCAGSRSCRTTRARLDQDCYEAFNIQVAALARRFRSAGAARWSSACPAASIPPTR